MADRLYCIHVKQVPRRTQMSNVQVAIDWVTQNIPRTNSGGVIAFPMFPGATKHDVRSIERSIQGNVQVANVKASKQFVIVNIK